MSQRFDDGGEQKREHKRGTQRGIAHPQLLTEGKEADSLCQIANRAISTTNAVAEDASDRASLASLISLHDRVAYRADAMRGANAVCLRIVCVERLQDKDFFGRARREDQLELIRQNLFLAHEASCFVGARAPLGLMSAALSHS